MKALKKANSSLNLETDKVNVEIISEEAGVVQEHLAAEGDTVQVGQVIAIVGAGSGAPAAAPAAPAAEAPVQKVEAAPVAASSY